MRLAALAFVALVACSAALAAVPLKPGAKIGSMTLTNARLGAGDTEIFSACDPIGAS